MRQRNFQCILLVEKKNSIHSVDILGREQGENIHMSIHFCKIKDEDKPEMGKTGYKEWLWWLGMRYKGLGRREARSGVDLHRHVSIVLTFKIIFHKSKMKIHKIRDRETQNGL